MNKIDVILVRPSVPGNIGAVARAMGNFGFANLILVDSRCDVNEEARNRAKHAQKILDNIQKVKSLKNILKNYSVSIATTGIIGSDFNIPRSPIMVEDAAAKLASSNGKVALVFGAEDTGLSNEEIELCSFTATIPSSKEYPVLNLSHAVSIFLYEISKQMNTVNIKSKFPLIEGKEKEALEKYMLDVIDSVEYRTVFEKRTQQLVWQRILGKSMPTRREAFAMIGLLKKISGKRQKVTQEGKTKKPTKKKKTSMRK